MAHTITIDLPYNLTHDLQPLEEMPEGFKHIPFDVENELDFFYQMGDEELRRVFTSIAALNQKHPEAPLAQLMATALAWERG